MPRGRPPAVESVDKMGSRWKLECTHGSSRHYRRRVKTDLAHSKAHAHGEFLNSLCTVKLQKETGADSG